MDRSEGLVQRKVAQVSSLGLNKKDDLKSGVDVESVKLLDNDFDNDADSKDTRLTIMEEVLLLGLKDKEVTNIIQSIDSLNESNAKKNVVVL